MYNHRTSNTLVYEPRMECIGQLQGLVCSGCTRECVHPAHTSPFIVRSNPYSVVHNTNVFLPGGSAL